MNIIQAGGYSWKQCQEQAEWRLNQCFEHSGVFLTTSNNPLKPPAYRNPSPFKVEAYARCVSIAAKIPCSSEVVVTGHNSDFFTCNFYTTDPENGNINRVYWFTHANRYYADV